MQLHLFPESVYIGDPPPRLVFQRCRLAGCPDSRRTCCASDKADKQRVCCPSRNQPRAGVPFLSGLEQGGVVRILGPYVVSCGWWAQGLAREYHFAELRRGDCLWVYYDRNRRRWFWQDAVE